jgi:hypothetical protein
VRSVPDTVRRCLPNAPHFENAGPREGRHDSDSLWVGAERARSEEGDAAVFEHWEPAEATVIDRKLLATGSATSSTPAKHAYVVEVHPPAGEPFRAEVHDPIIRTLGYRGADVGESVAVLVDFKRKKVKLDSHDPARHADWQAARRAKEDQFDAALAATPGSTDGDTAEPNEPPDSPVTGVLTDRSPAIVRRARAEKLEELRTAGELTDDQVTAALRQPPGVTVTMSIPTPAGARLLVLQDDGSVTLAPEGAPDA